MKRTQIIQLALGILGIVAFGVILTLARLRFSGSHSTNLLGALEEPNAEDVQQQEVVKKNKSVADYVLPMYCCPVAGSGQSCRLFDSIDRRKCGVMNGSENFEPGEEFQPTEAGFETCESVCAGQ